MLGLEVPVEQVLGQLPDGALVSTPYTALDSVRAAPVTTGLAQAFLLAALATLVLTAVAIVLVQIIGAPARARLSVVLRTLGMRRRALRGLAAWEVLPIVLAALLTGAVIGALVPWLLVRSVDLTGITGGDLQPTVSFDPTTIGMTLAGIAVVVGAAVLSSALLAGRTNLAASLRDGEER